MTDAAVKTYAGIVLGGRGVSATGTLKLHEGGIAWKKSHGESAVLVKKEDIVGLVWCLVPGNAPGQLRVRVQDKATLLFNGFSKAAGEEVAAYAGEHFGTTLERESFALAGRNWGQLSIQGSSVAFAVEGKHMFELPLNEVGEIQGTKEDAIMEFHVDDTAISEREDALCAVTFVIPDGNPEFPETEEEGEEAARSSAEAFKEAINAKADTLEVTQDEVIARLEHVSVLVPRGRYNIEFHPGFLDLDGQNHQYKIRYTSMHRLYVLPRAMPAGALVVIALDPPIRRGQTFYPQIVCFFDGSATEDMELQITDEFMEKKNTENRANLERSMTGRADNVFTRILRGLSGAKVTKHGTFRAQDGESPFIQCSYKNDAGTLYPLERSFFYLLKPTLLIPFEDIASVEFERQQSGMHAANVRTFDLAINMHATGTARETQHLFRGIQKQEWTPLFNFIEEKKIRIDNFDAAKLGPMSGALLALGAGGDVDPGMARMGMEEEDEEDDDFAGEGGSQDGSDFEGGGSDGDSDSDSGSDAEVIAEDGISAEAVTGKTSRRRGGDDAELVSLPEDDDHTEGEASDGGGASDVEVEPKPKKAKVAKAPAKPRAKKAAAVDGEKPAKKPKAKKDKNAPKRGLSSYMFFSAAKREQVKADNPGIAFTEIAGKIGALWKEISAEDKLEYEEMAKKDKVRYEKAKIEYEAKLAAEAEGVAADEGAASD